MRKIFIPAFALLMVAACTTTASYGPAMSPGDIGYRDQPIEEDRYRISYRGKDDGVAMDGALRRAAELTVKNGYDYFTVVARNVDAEGRRSGTSVGIGGSTGSGGRRGGSSVGVGIRVPLTGDKKQVIARLEVIMGRGIQPAGPQSYNARDVLSNLVR